MLNKAILELNGIFNVNKQSTQSSPQQETTAATAQRLKTICSPNSYKGEYQGNNV